MSEDDSGTNVPPFPADPDQHWTVPNMPLKIMTGAAEEEGGETRWWYGLTLKGTSASASQRPNRGVYSKKKGLVRKPCMPQRPAWVYEVEGPNVAYLGHISSFPKFVDFVAYTLGHEKPDGYLQQVITNYAVILNAFSAVRNSDWKGSGPPLVGIAPPGYEDFYDYFLPLLVSVDGTPCTDVEEGGCQDIYFYDDCLTVRDYVSDMFAALEELRNLKLLDTQIFWDNFPNQWPPEAINGKYEFSSRPFCVKLDEDEKGNSAELVETVIRIELVMDTQGYNIPTGFRLEVDGSQLCPCDDTKADDPTSSSSSSSSAYSSNASYGDGGGTPG